MNKRFHFSTDLIDFTDPDMYELSEEDGGFATPTVVWLLVRTCATGKKIGKVVMCPDELTDAREQLGKLLDVAVAGGWRGMDLLDTLMAKGIASDRLEALARKAGACCETQQELLNEVFTELYGVAAEPSVERRPRNHPQPTVLPPVKPAVPLRRPMAEHFTHAIDKAGEEHYVMTPEATLLMAAQLAYDLAEARNCRDGGRAARTMVAGVLEAAADAGYSRIEALHMILADGPYDAETMAAIEHLTGECGVDVIVRGMKSVGVHFKSI